MTATTPAPRRTEQLYREAERLLRIDPTNALRALDDVAPEPIDSPHRTAYERALSLRIIANSMLGLEDAALHAAKTLANPGHGDEARMAVATWLLRYSGDAASLARPLANGGCGRASCGHDPVTELALQVIQRSGDADQRRDAASALAAVRPDLRSLKLAGASALRDAGRVDAAVEFLISLGDPTMRHAAGILLYGEGRFADAVPLLIGRAELHGAASVGSALAAAEQPDPSLVSDVSAWPALRAISLEGMGWWKEAAQAWADAQRPREAWEAGLLGGALNAPAEGVEGRLAWRYYALTGKQRPTSAPGTDVERRYAAIGRATELIGQIRAGDRPRLAESESDPFKLEGLLTLIAKGSGEPVVAASRLISLDPPDRPRDLLSRLATLPARSDWLGSTDRRQAWRAWVDEHPAAPIPGPKVAQYALLARTLRGDTTPTSHQLEGLLKGLPVSEVVSAIGIALAKGWVVDEQLAQVLLEPDTIATSLQGSRGDLLPAVALFAGVQSYALERRRIAAEIGGALIALAHARGEISAEAAARAVSVVKTAIAEIPPVEDVLGPIVAYELELGWSDGRRNILAGPILAGRAGLDAKSAGVPRGSRTRYYGPLGRALVLKEAGHLQTALDLAEATDEAPHDQRVRAITEIQVALAARLAEVGSLDEAVSVAIDAQPDAAGAAGTIARRIADEHEGKDYGGPIGLLKTLHDAYPDEPAVAVAYAELLNRRAVVRMNNDGPLNTIMPDLELALDLDPDDMSIRRNLALTYFKRSVEAFERDPRRALQDLRRAYSVDPNNAQLREVGADVAMACGAQLIERRQIGPAEDAVDFALELDPSNEQARRVRAMLMFR